MDDTASASVRAPEGSTPLRRIRRRWFWLCAALVLLGLLGTAGWHSWADARRDEALAGMSFIPVTRGDLEITVSASGALEAVSNVDIMCTVAGESTIVELVPEGTQVKEGDVICKLDATEWEQKVEETTIAVEGAEGEVTWATEQLALQKSENESKQETAEVELRLAKLSLDEYTLGEYPQETLKAERAIEMAGIALAKAEEDYNQARVLYARGFTTATEVKEKRREFIKAQGDLQEQQSAFKVLTTFKHEKRLTELQDKLKQAQSGRERADAEAQSNLTQKQSDLQAKQQKLMVLRQQLEFNQKQVEACTVKAPADGMVVYGSSSRYYYGEQMTVGSKIYQGRLLIRLPDTSRMKAVIPVSEHRVSMIVVDEKNPVTASCKVAGHPEPIPGRVTKKSVMPSNERGWLSGDQKSYPVDVELNETPSEIKPGTSVNVTMNVRTVPDVLIVPTNCVYRRDGKAYVFVHEEEPAGAGVAPREVEVGEASESHCEIRSGVAEGDPVLALEVGQGSQLLEAAGLPEEAKPEPQPEPELAPEPESEPEPASVALRASDIRLHGQERATC